MSRARHARPTRPVTHCAPPMAAKARPAIAPGTPRADPDGHRPCRRPDAGRRGHGAAGLLRAARCGARQPRVGRRPGRARVPAPGMAAPAGARLGRAGLRAARGLPGRDRARAVAQRSPGVPAGRLGPRPLVPVGAAARNADGFVTISRAGLGTPIPGCRGDGGQSETVGHAPHGQAEEAVHLYAPAGLSSGAPGLCLAVGSSEHGATFPGGRAEGPAIGHRSPVVLWRTRCLRHGRPPPALAGRGNGPFCARTSAGFWSALVPAARAVCFWRGDTGSAVLK